ncbi:hypothetical protein FO488_11165 [Geobacter sp. FeAm09]|uniref:DUF6716 putative glycosyltransferase n=1 Tax=Geobacter sp. FeAm09 TaxID=2597769 RepID=UPI0011ED87DC|nr:DUF6716 putative glycosyltransferase [Geobacter sp. FeAm09]QEM68663.1 hypothetical protein FO488_11165 [Geobacter sp. FeAm09]
MGSDNGKNRRTILFVPSNPSHVATQVPVAVELACRGHKPLFLSRDALIEEEYRVEPFLAAQHMPIMRYEAFYESDSQRFFPVIGSYRKLAAELSRWLAPLGADAVVTCNDDAALFDRMVMELFRDCDKPAFLIQESVRPSIRKLPFLLKLKEQGGNEILHQLCAKFAYKLSLGAFFRKGYAHSRGTTVFAAGDMFRQILLQDGVDDSRILVTGQPRLDRKTAPGGSGGNDRDTRDRVLLYCNQPVKCSQQAQERLFVRLVEAVDAMDNVKLLVKLHPRDLPESHWLGLLRPGQGQSLVEITRTRPLADCFTAADAFMTIASTTCLEAMDYGLPVGLVNYLPIDWYLSYDRFKAVISVPSEQELRPAIATLLFDEPVRQRLRLGAEQVLRNELHLRDGRSAWRIANHIETLLH